VASGITTEVWFLPRDLTCTPCGQPITIPTPRPDENGEASGQLHLQLAQAVGFSGAAPRPERCKCCPRPGRICGFLPHSRLAQHTEVRVVVRAVSEAATHAFVVVKYPVCPSCDAVMRAAAAQHNLTTVVRSPAGYHVYAPPGCEVTRDQHASAFATAFACGGANAVQPEFCSAMASAMRAAAADPPVGIAVPPCAPLRDARVSVTVADGATHAGSSLCPEFADFAAARPSTPEAPVERTLRSLELLRRAAPAALAGCGALRLDPDGSLMGHQINAVAALGAAESGSATRLLVAPCGAGKTKVMLEWCRGRLAAGVSAEGEPPVVLVLAPPTSLADLAEPLRRMDVCVCVLGERALDSSDESQRKRIAAAVSATLRRNGGMTSVVLMRHCDFFGSAELVAAAADGCGNLHVVIDEAALLMRTAYGRAVHDRRAQQQCLEAAKSIVAVSAVPCFDSAAGDAASASPLMQELLANTVPMEHPWEKTYVASVCVVDTPMAAKSDMLGNSGLLRSSGGLSPAVEGAVLAAVHHAAGGGHRHILVATHLLDVAHSILTLLSLLAAPATPHTVVVVDAIGPDGRRRAEQLIAAPQPPPQTRYIFVASVDANAAGTNAFGSCSALVLVGTPSWSLHDAVQLVHRCARGPHGPKQINVTHVCDSEQMDEPQSALRRLYRRLAAVHADMWYKAMASAMVAAWTAVGGRLDHTYGQATPTCNLCFEDATDPVASSPCGHAFCRECIRDYVDSSIATPGAPLQCTVCDNPLSTGPLSVCPLPEVHATLPRVGDDPAATIQAAASGPSTAPLVGAGPGPAAE